MDHTLRSAAASSALRAGAECNDIDVCAAAHGVMSVVAVIVDPDALRKIIEWAQANQVRGPPAASA